VVNRIMLAVAIAIAAAPIGIVLPAAQAQSQKPKAASPAFDGQQLFATTCGWCPEGGGRVAGKAPKLAGTKRSDEFIVNRIKNGKEGAMPAFAGTFNDKKIKAIVVYIHSLKDEGQ
jgi:mono/diheme cytochrome c family protein